MTIPETMRAAVYHGRRDLRFEEVPVPSPGPGELLIEVGTVGVCGSDVGEWAHGPHQHPVDTPHPATGHHGPIIPGHEFSGVVVALGEGVDERWLGSSIASCGSVACGRCPACLRGETNLCRSYAGVGLHRDGALAGYVTAPIECCLALEETGLSLDEAALVQPMSIAVHNVTRAGDVDGQTVLLQGVGGIGAFLVCALVDAGARVVASDMDAERLAIARQLGAHETVLVTGEAAADRELIAAAVGGAELRVVFEVSGSRPGVLAALDLAPRGSRIVLVGIQKAPVEIDLARFTLDEKTLIGTNALVRESDFPRALELVASRRDWGVIAPRVVPLDEVIDEALLPMSEGRPRAIKTLIDPRGAVARPLLGRSQPDAFSPAVAN
ncbi:zinc-binding dehydrogenase [Herbiconiux sp. A18JL235]|uniref:Zinc-binding dehydrogenase n=1 Tax=Herbiconiux sp. A18JL235 TaxID=3152363 RepID=A0AB39BIL3_9MICO